VNIPYLGSCAWAGSATWAACLSAGGMWERKNCARKPALGKNLPETWHRANRCGSTQVRWAAMGSPGSPVAHPGQALGCEGAGRAGDGGQWQWTADASPFSNGERHRGCLTPEKRRATLPLLAKTKRQAGACLQALARSRNRAGQAEARGKTTLRAEPETEGGRPTGEVEAWRQVPD